MQKGGDLFLQVTTALSGSLQYRAPLFLSAKRIFVCSVCLHNFRSQQDLSKHSEECAASQSNRNEKPLPEEDYD